VILKPVAALAGVIAMALTGWAASVYLRKPYGRTFLQFSLPAPGHASYWSAPAISPDGRVVAFAAGTPNGQRMLWIQPLGGSKAKPVQNTDGATAPFWSPDSKALGFFAGGKLKTVAAGGGAVTVLCDVEAAAAGGTWNRNGVILFARGFYDGLYRISASGGTPERVTRLDSRHGERAQLWPHFLPDGKHFLFYTLARDETSNGIAAGSLDSRARTHVLQADTNAIYTERLAKHRTHGFLLFARGRKITAKAFDPVQLTVGSEELTFSDDIAYLKAIRLLPASVSSSGLFAWQSIDEPKHQLVWLSRTGRQTGVLNEPGIYGSPRLSRDGRYVAVDRGAPDEDVSDIWLYAVDSYRRYQFTAEPTHKGAPVWSPDGSQIVYFSNPGGHFDLFRRRMGTSVQQETIANSSADKYPCDWSADGKYLLYGSLGASTNSDLWAMPIKTGGDPFMFLQTVNAEGYARFSPDAHWVAYQSDESGRSEVYVEAFPRADRHSKRWQISNDGGGLPKWRGDGKELYYVTENGRMMSVTVNFTDGVAPQTPRMLFQAAALPHTWAMFDVTSDGGRFLVNTPREWSSSSPIVVVR
jgi:eukaryotic-like serine/threonine-protein kinase